MHPGGEPEKRPERLEARERQRQRAEQAAHLQQCLLAAGIARPLDPAQGGLREFGRLGALLQRAVIEIERRRPVPLGEGRDSAQQGQQQ